MAKNKDKNKDKKDLSPELQKSIDTLDSLLTSNGEIDIEGIITKGISEGLKKSENNVDVGALGSIIFGVFPIGDIVNAIASPVLVPIKESLELIKPQIEEIKKTAEEIKNESNEEIRKKMEKRLKKTIKKLHNPDYDKEKYEGDPSNEDIAPGKLEQLKEQVANTAQVIKDKVMNAIAEAKDYFEQIKQAGQAIPPAVQGLVIQTSALITQATGAISAAVMNPGSASFTAPSILTATQSVMKAKDDVKAAALQLTTSIAQVDKCLKIIFDAPIVGPALKVAVMTPIDTIKTLVETVIKLIP